jgi:ribonuclease P/MRP protein subunit RPP1
VDCDIISLDLTQRFDFFVKIKTVAPAIEKGVKFEICYAPGVHTDNSGARRNMITNASQLIRATRGGRGIIISSEASTAAGCRGPSDVINLAAIWGLGQEKGHEAVSKLARSVVVSAHLKRTSYRGVIDVVYGGGKPAPAEVKTKQVNGQKKRGAEGTAEMPDAKKSKMIPTISKREQKRQKKALLEAQQKKTVSPAMQS